MLPAQAAQLLALVARQALAQAAVDLGLAGPGAKRLRRAAELLGELGNRPARRAHQLDGLTPELRRVCGTGSWHFDSFPGTCRRQWSSVHESGGTPVPA